MINSQIIHIKNQDQMVEFAQKFAKKTINNTHQIIGLKGTLGAGKSFFAKHFINQLQNEKTEILSPTFNICLNYQTKIGEISHFDLYRLKNKEELENVGFFESIKNNICLIEWPEIALDYLKTLEEFTLLEFEINEQESRIIQIKSY